MCAGLEDREEAGCEAWRGSAYKYVVVEETTHHGDKN
jgi:hypothetical protein